VQVRIGLGVRLKLFDCLSARPRNFSNQFADIGFFFLYPKNLETSFSSDIRLLKQAVALISGGEFPIRQGFLRMRSFGICSAARDNGASKNPSGQNFSPVFARKLIILIRQHFGEKSIRCGSEVVEVSSIAACFAIATDCKPLHDAGNVTPWKKYNF